jgi:hypothetical protein
MARTERASQPALLRDVFGPLPFRLSPVPTSVLAWGGTVVRLAETAYQHRTSPTGYLDPTRLAVLADVLEDVLV